jgi:uncharacterized protein (TIGR03435 family)
MVLILFTLLTFQPTFEVATVKPTPPETRILGHLVSNPGGRVIAQRCNLGLLLKESLGVEMFQIVGDPSWLKQDPFDIEAKPPETSEASKLTGKGALLNAEQRQMLLALLVDRFQLKYHRETKQGPVYFLVRTNKKLKLEEPAMDNNGRSWVGSPNNGTISGDGIAGKNISMALLATRLSRYLERPVIDHTGIEGTFDFKFEYTPDEHPDVVSSILFSVQQIGLKLESGKGPGETIVIDSVERPTRN